MSDQNNLIVYLEFEGGKIADVSLELLTKGRTLATGLGCKLEAVVAGDKLEGIESQVFPYGVDRLYKVQDDRLYPYTSLPHSSILINLFREIKPQIAFMGATSIGRDLGPRVSSRLHSGLTADCTALEIGNHKDPKTGKEYENLLMQIRPAFGGNIVATIVNPECRPQMATVREGVMKKEVLDPAYKGEVIDLDVNKYTAPEDFVVEIIDRHVAKSKVNLKGSPIIVAGGSGVGHTAAACPHSRRRGGSKPRGRRRRLGGPRPSDRPDRRDRTSEALHRLRYLRPDSAYRRYAGLLDNHLHQQRPQRAHQRYRRLRNHRQL